MRERVQDRRSAGANAKKSSSGNRANRRESNRGEVRRGGLDYADDAVTGEVLVVGRKRKKRKKKHYFLKFLLIVALAVGSYFLITSDLFNIRVIEVAGNAHYTREQIAEMSGVRTGENMFEADMGKAEDRLLGDPYIKTAQIHRKPFHRIVIDVEERAERFILKYGEKYAVADFDGMVLRVTNEPPPLTIVEDLKITKAKQGEALIVTENGLLSDTIKFLQTVEKNDMFFKRVIASDIVARAYIYDGLMCRGTYRNIANNIDSLKQVIVDLQQQNVERGTIIVNGNGTCTFTPVEGA
jgi:cell division protein FtsQ